MIILRFFNDRYRDKFGTSEFLIYLRSAIASRNGSNAYNRRVFYYMLSVLFLLLQYFFNFVPTVMDDDFISG